MNSNTRSNLGSSASWQIPRGVSKGNWDYVRARKIAEEYDEFLQDDPLTKVDRQIIDRYLPALDTDANLNSPLVADFGCGNGRTLLPIMNRGYRGLGVDLSFPMLENFAEKSATISGAAKNCTLMNANLVELDGLKDNSVDHGVCMFSTLGMIAGSHNRATFLQHARRSIKPGGQFIVHAHNVWFQLRHPGGTKWVLQSAFARLRCSAEFGDRVANYRNVNQLFIHSFRRRELQTALHECGFESQTWFGVKPNCSELPKPISFKNPFSLRALKLVGWIVVCA